MIYFFTNLVPFPRCTHVAFDNGEGYAFKAVCSFVCVFMCMITRNSCGHIHMKCSGSID